MASSASLSCRSPRRELAPSPSWSLPSPAPALASTDTRSLAGSARRSSATPIRYCHISICKSARSSSECSLAPGIAASDHSKKRGHWAPSTPISSQMTCIGSGTESDETMSIASPPWMRSTSALAFDVTPASIRRTIEGLKPGWTNRR